MTLRFEVPTFVINLDRDIHRRNRILSQMEKLKDFKTTLVSAVDGSTLPNSLTFALCDSWSWMSRKGAIGCFLSHVRVWEMAADLTTPFVVVLEDDANASQLGKLFSLELPQDFDIIFINQRMSPKAGPYESDFVCMGESLRHVDVKNGGFGSDGYILTPNAAKKLVDACKRDLYFGHVDGRLARYATSEFDLTIAGSESIVAQIIQKHHNHRRLPQLGLLKGYVSSLPLVWHSGLTSSREILDG